MPLALERLGVDPAIASSVFVTAITDVVGFFAFLGLADLARSSLKCRGRPLTLWVKALETITRHEERHDPSTASAMPLSAFASPR